VTGSRRVPRPATPFSGARPVYNLSVGSCVVGLERVCAMGARGRELAERRRREKPKKWRRWYY